MEVCFCSSHPRINRCAGEACLCVYTASAGFGEMFSAQQNWEELEDELYRDDGEDSEGSEYNSELEFHLYSQLHYSSNPGEMADLDDAEEEEEHERKRDADTKPSSPACDTLQLHLKKKNTEKPKKRKTQPQGSKLSSSFFEEVIVIDSGPDVITISDDSAEDFDGVCSSKGGALPKQQTSTPAQQQTKTRSRSPAVPVAVLCSSSESETTSDSSDSSDSEDLENWMILGQGKRDEDQSISLHLEGASDSSTDVDEDGSWLVSEKDKEAQIYNKEKSSRTTRQFLPNRYYTGKNIHCKNCNKTGHLSKNCPEPKKLVPCFLCGAPGHLVIECPNKHCNNCGHPGHLFNSCSEKPYWYKQCHRCSMKGHFLDACPEIWRQYHFTTENGPPVKRQAEDMGRSPAYCYNCSKKGHFGYACTKQRMFKGFFPTIPFVNHYDTLKEINRRQHRIKLKTQEMRKNSSFPRPSQTPSTLTPPKKKPKINTQTNNTSYRPPKPIHKSTPNHIFFKDEELRVETPTTKKFRDGAGSAKQWKPKRPVPTSRNPLPPAKPVLDEEDDFPRGGRPKKDAEERRKMKKKNKMKRIHSSLTEGQQGKRRDHPRWTVGENRWRPPSTKPKAEQKKNGKKFAQKKLNTQYPTDEDLFSIKQRKRSR
uniref:Zinc finger CCHC domain-containing protein 7 n=1 Tax=Oryzias latipes TaxID=8090 RepID=A0A3P9KBR2_ORYLA